MRRVGMMVLSSVLGLALAGCGEDDGGGSGSDVEESARSPVASLDELRGAETCPYELDTGATTPDGLGLGPVEDVDVSEYDGDGVDVACRFPLIGSPRREVVYALLVAAPAGTDVTTMETSSGGSWLSSAYNATGVATEDVTAALPDLEEGHVEVLEGVSSLTLTPASVDGAGQAVLLVYGEGTPTREDLAALTAALRPSSEDSGTDSES